MNCKKIIIELLDTSVIKIYTDGSCNVDNNIGGWAAVLLWNDDRILLKGVELQTTHNRMELFAVIKSIEFVDEKCKGSSLLIYTDSQYVHHIPERKEKLKRNNYLTKKGTPIQNADLVKLLVNQIENHLIEFIKVKAHQKPGQYSNEQVNCNCEVDKMAREVMREYCRKTSGGYPQS